MFCLLYMYFYIYIFRIIVVQTNNITKKTWEPKQNGYIKTKAINFAKLERPTTNPCIGSLKEIKFYTDTFNFNIFIYGYRELIFFLLIDFVFCLPANNN